MFFWLMGWRLVNRRGWGTNAAVLVLLALAAALFTAVLEAVWIWAYQDYQPSEISDVYFTFVLGIPPALKILVLGLAIALFAGGRHALQRRQASLRVGEIG
jgi:methionine sulfoxide reductase heme-binding subunit